MWSHSLEDLLYESQSWPGTVRSGVPSMGHYYLTFKKARSWQLIIEPLAIIRALLLLAAQNGKHVNVCPRSLPKCFYHIKSQSCYYIFYLFFHLFL